MGGGLFYTGQANIIPVYYGTREKFYTSISLAPRHVRLFILLFILLFFITMIMCFMYS